MSRARSVIGAPAHLTASHSLEQFSCGEPSLDDWLRRRALGIEASGASRTYVACAEGRVVGFYCLSTGALLREHAPGSVSRNTRDPIPVVILGRLAVDQHFQSAGIGSGLLKSAALQTIAASETVGVRALMLHAISPRARTFYARHGFTESPVNPMMMMASIGQLKRAFQAVG